MSSFLTTDIARSNATELLPLRTKEECYSSPFSRIAQIVLLRIVELLINSDILDVSSIFTLIDLGQGDTLFCFSNAVKNLKVIVNYKSKSKDNTKTCADLKFLFSSRHFFWKLNLRRCFVILLFCFVLIIVSRFILCVCTNLMTSGYRECRTSPSGLLMV